MKTLPFVYFEGQVRPAGEANVSLAANSLQYGTTCFGGIRGYIREGKVVLFRLQDHFERLMHASKILGFGFEMAYETFHVLIQDLVMANNPASDFYIRPFLFTQDEVLSPKPKGLKFELAIYLVALGHYFDPQKGLRLMVSSWRKFPDASFPTKAKAGGCYINSFLATGDAMRCGYDEALLMDHEGYIVEASVANLLMVYRGRLIMPEVGSAQLEGITARTAITLLKDAGWDVSFERIDRSMLYTCSELLLLGTAAQVVFAHSVDDRVVGQGDEGTTCRFLRRLFAKVLEGTHSRSTEWLSRFEGGA